MKKLRQFAWLWLLVTLLVAIIELLGLSQMRVSELDSDRLTVTFIDVGQGDSILVETPSGNTMLVDGGDRSAGDKVVELFEKGNRTHQHNGREHILMLII